MAASMSLNSSHLLCVPTLHDEPECVLVLGHFEQLHGVLLVGREAAHLPDLVLHELGEGPAVSTVSQLVDVPPHLVALVEAYSHGKVQSHGCCSPMRPGQEAKKSKSIK